MAIKSIKKAKGPFLYTKESNKYYDLRQNSNILGHSHKTLTRSVKNSLSNCWNLSSINTINHSRLIKLLTTLYSDRYIVRATFSLQELFSRLFLNTNRKVKVLGEGLTDWLTSKYIRYSKAEEGAKKLNIYDMTEFYLNKKECPLEETPTNLNLLNYYWHPEIELNLPKSPDGVILPQLYCGNFKFILVLVKKENSELLEATNELEEVQSLYISSALKMYYAIKRVKSRIYLEDINERLITKGRLISFKEDASSESNKELYKELITKGVLLTNEPPYYSYLPQLLTARELNFLKKVLK